MAPARASTSNSGTLSGVVVVRSGRLFFSQSGARNARPSCSIDRWVLDVTTSSGQAQAAVILTAFTQNRLVHISGTGTCTDWPDTESVQEFYIDN
ncbi:MAG: hypothetical protein EOO61_21655 [Hymenobacter sp.]|nr:MAG: hypothetical protein EOO61_21655 [Hymenobacter sp.]